MFNKSLPHIIFNKWTFIDLMFNLMTICALWRVKSWNFIHFMNSFAPIPWDSSNNASTLLIKSSSLYLTLIATCTPFAIVGADFGKIIISYLVRNIGSTLLDIFYALSCSFFLNHIMNQRFKILNSLFKLFIFMVF